MRGAAGQKSFFVVLLYPSKTQCALQQFPLADTATPVRTISLYFRLLSGHMTHNHHWSGAVAGAVARARLRPRARAGAAAAMSTQHYDHIVVGAGINGCWAAYHLARRGSSVLLLEKFPLPHSRGSSHGQSRGIRRAYPDPGDYTHNETTINIKLFKSIHNYCNNHIKPYNIIKHRIGHINQNQN